MTAGYVFDQAWTLERTRLAGLEAALDAGSRQHLARLGAGPGSRCLEASSPGDTEYGRRLPAELEAAGLSGVEAEGRCPLVRGGSAPAAGFLRLTLEKLRRPLLARDVMAEAEFEEAIAALGDPAVTVVMPMTVAAWGWREGDR
jgi:hypothetical protein